MRCLLMQLRMRLLRPARVKRPEMGDDGRRTRRRDTSQPRTTRGSVKRLLTFAANVAMFSSESSLAKE